MYIISQLSNKRVSGPTQMVYERVLLRISIFIDKSLHAVRDCAGVVLHSELLFPFSTGPLDETLVFAEFALDVR